MKPNPPQTDYMIEMRCCMCKKYLGEKKGGEKPGIISYGYCDDCVVKVKAEISEFSKNKRRQEVIWF